MRGWLARTDPLIALRIVMLTVVVWLAVDTQADPDLWGHVKFGELMTASGAVRIADPYSFTSDQEWINHEWLSELAMFGAYRAAGPVGLIALRLSIMATVVALVGYRLRRTRAVPLVHDLALAAIVLGIHAQTATVRPQLFSILLFAVMLTLLDVGRRRHALWLVVPPLFVPWVNFHGGWLVGAGILAIWAAAETVTTLRRERRLTLLPAGVLAASLLATLANPYGIGMLHFLQDTVGLGRADIQEWQPVHALGIAFIAYWTFTAGFLVFVVWSSPRRLEPYQWAILIVLTATSLRVSRLTGFFAVGTVFLLVPQLQAMAAARARPAPGYAPLAVAITCWLAAFVAIAWTAPVVSRRLQCIEMSDEHSPDREVAAIVEQDHLHGRMLTYFDWGQYAIWHFHPAIQVSYDGRRETVYSRRVRDLHQALYDGTPAGRSYLESLDADFAWLPASVPAAKMLEDAGWSVRFRSPTSVLFVRQHWAGPPATPHGASGHRCFPDP